MERCNQSWRTVEICGMSYWSCQKRRIPFWRDLWGPMDQLFHLCIFDIIFFLKRIVLRNPHLLHFPYLPNRHIPLHHLIFDLLWDNPLALLHNQQSIKQDYLKFLKDFHRFFRSLCSISKVNLLLFQIDFCLMVKQN